MFRTKTLSQSVSLFAIGGFATLVMIKGGGQLMVKTFATGQVTPALQIPMGYVYGAIPFSGAIILFYCISFVAELWRGAPVQPSAQDPATAPVWRPFGLRHFA